MKIITITINHLSPLKKVSQSLGKLRLKPGITKGILKSMKIKDKIDRKMCWTKNVSKKQELNLTFKSSRNHITNQAE